MESENNSSPFNEFAERYDAWFDNQGSLIFAIEVMAFKTILADLPNMKLKRFLRMKLVLKDIALGMILL